MRSQGEIEAAICDGVSRFEQEYVGRGPRDIRAYLLGSLLVVHLQGVLTPAERQLVAPRLAAVAVGGDGGNGIGPASGNGQAHGFGYDSDGGNGRALLKQVRSHVVALGRPRLQEMVESATGVKLVSLHHDISTVTGEEVIVFSLAEAPACRPRKKA